MKIWILLLLFHTLHITSPHPCPVGYILVPCQNEMTLTPCNPDVHCATIQQLHLKNRDTSLAQCDQVGVCTCPPDMIFTGSECVPFGEWADPYHVLREKWHNIPIRVENYKHDKIEVGVDQDPIISSRQLKDLEDIELAQIWQNSSPTDCFTKHYREEFKGLRVLDIGSGFARQSLQFAIYGSIVTFLDVVKENLEVVERLAIYFRIQDRTKFILLDNFETLGDSLETYDVMLALGSLQHSPREIIEKEMAIILPHLKVGGRWLQLAYPITRLYSTYVLDFTELGRYTDNDGQNFPWTEWYETGKLLKVLQYDGKQKFEVAWCGIINKEEFIWFELVHTSNGIETCEYNKYLSEPSAESWDEDLFNYILNTP